MILVILDEKNAQNAYYINHIRDSVPVGSVLMMKDKWLMFSPAQS